MRSVVLVVSVALIGVSSLFAASDSEVSELLLRSTRVIDNDAVSDWMVRRAESLCEHDTNRFVRLIYELAQTNDARIANKMIQLLGTHGSTAHLPFLRKASTNTMAGMSAITSILQISGVNETTCSDLDKFLHDGRTDGMQKIYVCRSYYNWSNRPNVSQSVRDGLREIFISYGTSNTDVAVAFDRLMCSVDASYKNRRRRLRTLRSASGPDLHPYQAGYVTNAINNLIAYPEANLPE